MRRSRWNAIRLLLAAALVGLLASTSGAGGARTPVLVDRDGVAVGGYDVVAYFTQGRAVKGDAALAHEWGGATWRFASPEHRARFAADPAAYAPRYGGWCAFGAAQGYAAETDPVDAWTIRDGKLYLNWDAGVKARWLRDVPGHVGKADTNWPGIQQGLLDGSAKVVRKK
jgi:hypothetical protein